MATFVYAPAIRVHVETEKNGIIDISDDIASWELVRRSNNPSSFNFVLQNTQRKYDTVFRPSDRISVELKRITWMRVFTGTLNSVPIYSSWPRALPLSATCSLKKLQFWPWSPSSVAAQDMVAKVIATLQNSKAGDSGLSQLITESLVRVTGWDQKAIHIGAVPNAWFQWAQKTEQDMYAAGNMAAVLGSAVSGGTGVIGSNIQLAPGTFDGTNLNATQITNAKIIYSVVLTQPKLTTANIQDKVATIALMVAMTESSLQPGTTAVDHDSLGLFQQRAGWGSAQQRLDPQWATNAFLNGATSPGGPGYNAGGHISGLLDYNTYKTSNNLPMIAQGVQQSAFADGSNYAKWLSFAQSLTTKLRAGLDDLAQTPATSQNGVLPGTGAVNTGAQTGKFTGDQVASVAVNLINVLNKPAHIQYSQSRASDPTTSNPDYLDCSQLIRWVIYHVTGKVWAPRDTHSQYPACKIKNIPMDIAKYIRGCLLYGSGSGNGSMPANGDPEHCGIAVGDGTNHVAAHTDGVPIAQQVDISPLPGGLYWGALHPWIDYSNAATTKEAAAWLQKNAGIAKAGISTTNLGDVVNPNTATGAGTGSGDDSSSSPFYQIVSVLSQAPLVSGDIFGGSRYLINNEPFLPWLGNLTNSSMRAYCSAPNGDFMAWFPDYFNVWKTAAIMDIKSIELKDFSAEWSDQQIVTHEYVLGSMRPIFDSSSGTIADGAADTYSTVTSMINSHGIAVMEGFPEIFETIYGKPASNAFVNNYLSRFGARPNVENMPNIMQGAQEGYMALWLFMKHWSEQFNANVPMTFMPELWPGMIIRIAEKGFQAYVTEVTHRGTYGPNGGFTTDAKIIAPAPIDEKLRGSLFGMLDIFNGASASKGTKQSK